MSQPTLSYPFTGTYAITQPFGPTTFTGEPPGFWFSDKSLSYFNSSDPSFPNLTSQRVSYVHSGIDFAVPQNTPILAAADGTVTMAGADTTGYGQCIRVNHTELGLTTLYAHLLSFAVKQGDTVRRGQVIARSNNTGSSTGAHLHWSVLRDSDGHYDDPNHYLSTTPVKPPIPPKPENAVHWQQFSGKTMVGTTRLYAGPDNRFPVLGEINPGTQLTFSAWILGQPRIDFSVRAWDRRWYYLSSPDVKGSGWISSSRVNGNAPGSSA